MPEKKKSQSVEDIISEYQKFHHATGKKFEERLKKWESFHDPDNTHALQLAHHAHYTVFGKPGHEKEFPGAFNASYKVLDKHYADDNAKVDDEDKLAEILETYADTFLEKDLGDGYKKMIAHAQKEIAKILADEKNPKKLAEKKKQSLREFKGTLLGQYNTDQQGNPANIFSDGYIKALKGKKKVEVIEGLRNLSERIKGTYTSHLQQKALEGLISEDDRLQMAEYITPIFEERGWKNKKPHIMRPVAHQVVHYGALLQGQGEDLKKLGYEATVPAEKKKK